MTYLYHKRACPDFTLFRPVPTFPSENSLKYDGKQHEDIEKNMD